MSRVLYCSSVFSRSPKGLRLFPFNYNEYILRREFHILRVILNEPPSTKVRISNIKFPSLRSSLHTSSALASAEDPQSKTQEESIEHETHEDRPQAGDGGEGRQSITDRLRRLSMTSADAYELSPMAAEKAQEMAKVRAKVKQRGDEWKWDQRNLRPGGPPNQNRRFERMRNWDEDEDDNHYSSRPAFSRQDGGRGRYNSPRRQTDYWDGEEEEEEEEEEGYNRRRMPPRNQYQRSYNERRSNTPSYRGHQHEEDEFDRPSFRDFERSGGFRDSSSSNGPQRRSRPQALDDEDDDPAEYEVEMQKLRDRMEKAKDEKISKETEAATKNKTERREKESDGPSLAANAHYISSDHQHTPTSASFNPRGDTDEGPVEDKVDLNLAALDPDTFGNLTIGSTSTLVKDTVGLAIQAELREDAKMVIAEENEEEDDTRFIPQHGERWTSRKLIEKVRELLQEKKLKEAIDTFLGALTEGGFHFDRKEIRHHFNVLIHECAEVGYVDMAFRLFRDMRKRGYDEKIQTFSSLLNACANSPWAKEENLERIDRLLITIKEKGHIPNKITFHALIKAYGRLGETMRAFGVVDLMLQEKVEPDIETFSMLLQACITDKKNGFRHALVTWKKLQSMKDLRPNIFTFNLLLRSVRDCGIELHLEEGQIKPTEFNFGGNQDFAPPLLPPIVTEEDSNRLLSYLIEEKPPQEDAQLVLDNLGEPEIVNVKELRNALSYPFNRLAVLGGIRGFFTQMTRYKVGPNLKTVSQLLECAKGKELIDVLHLLKAYKIKADLDFYNIAIARCNNMGEELLAKEFLKMLNHDHHAPNIMTFGALALGCKTWTEAQALLETMESTKYTPNIIVMGSFLKTAIKKNNPYYIIKLMDEVKRREIPIDTSFLRVLLEYRETTQKAIVKKEMGKPVEPKRLADALENFPDIPERFAFFKMKFKPWLKSVDIKVEPEDPWREEYLHFRREKRHIDYNQEEDLDDLIAEKLGEKVTG